MDSVTISETTRSIKVTTPNNQDVNINTNILQDHSSNSLLHDLNRQPWDKLPDESTLWYERFLIYRDLTSSDRNVSQAYGVYVTKNIAQRQHTIIL